jgi:anti-sigma B factor antagonist
MAVPLASPLVSGAVPLPWALRGGAGVGAIPRTRRLPVYFHCHTTERDGWSVVGIVGELDLATVPTARATVADALRARRPPRVVLDLTGVEFVDSMGLGVVLGALKRIRADGGSLRVVVATDRVRKALALTGLDRLLSVFDTLDDALTGDERADAGDRDG